MSAYFLRFLLIAVTSISFGKAFAETEVSTVEMLRVFKEKPLGCLGASTAGCKGLSGTQLISDTRGLETNTMAILLAPNAYVVIKISSNIAIGEKGFCYPNFAEDVMAATMVLTSDLAGGNNAAQPVPDELRTAIENAALRPMANMVGDEIMCVRYLIPSDRERSDDYLARSYIGKEVLGIDEAVRLFPIEAQAGLKLLPVEQ